MNTEPITGQILNPVERSHRLASVTWGMCKQQKLRYEEIVTSCAILLSSVSQNSGEPIATVLAAVTDQAQRLDAAVAAATAAAGKKH